MESVRQSSWTPNKEIQDAFDARLAKDSKFAKRIKKARQRARHYQKNNASVDKPPQSLGSFAAAHSVSTDYALKDQWLLDSGSDIYVTNNKERLR